ncbi:hypothetical protein CC1G_06365 [Coprinopsis cinerea okayama7|uniref:DUF572 domain-containing protein n=1 Tax=Coprinopsis cinerea (strain Okayama-7 / 130 / ATCC MYA-4618 / FGSC 9003) TaxID=240176 RepID=A8NTQ5_COPC7|nr:hypothetical protein CC1G_06365 [Coprinopsis cinerea okayama7\|eukprot:XP_001836280.2 hypothetical protein CC1G_06365 [Coprinopsis cinerea okayama7\
MQGFNNGTCNNHIGMGVRYNAEKKKIGNYYSTPIYSFRCKCHLCDGWFEIQTDPKNTRYVVTSGARRKEEDWDPEEHGGFAIHGQYTFHTVFHTDKEGVPLDPLAALEKTTTTEKLINEVQKPRIEALQTVSDRYNADPYTLSSKVRRRFREEKKIEKEKRKADDSLKGQYGLPEELKLLDDNNEMKEDAKALWTKAKRELEERKAGDVKRRRLTVDGLPSSSSTSLLSPSSSSRSSFSSSLSRISSSSLMGSSRPSSASSKPKADSLNSLKARILQNTASRSRQSLGSSGSAHTTTTATKNGRNGIEVSGISKE